MDSTASFIQSQTMTYVSRTSSQCQSQRTFCYSRGEHQAVVTPTLRGGVPEPARCRGKATSTSPSGCKTVTVPLVPSGISSSEPFHKT